MAAPEPVSCAAQILIGSVDPDALKIPARRAEYSLTESTLSPFQAEPAQARIVTDAGDFKESFLRTIGFKNEGQS
jgi:hypothetical protein